MNLILCAILGTLLQESRGYTPLPAITTEAVNSNFLDMAQEIQRRSLNNGGVVNANITLSSSANISGNVRFGSSVTFEGGVFGNINTLNASTYTIINTNISLTGTALGPCLAGSTITFTTGNVRVTAVFTGNINAEASNTESVMAFLIDGAFPTGVTSSLGLIAAPDAGLGGAVTWPVSFNYQTRTALSSGSHSFCLTAYGGSAGSGMLDCTPGVCNFEVRESR